MVWTLIVLVLHMPSVTATAPLAERVDDAAAARLGGDVLHPGLGLLVLSFIAVLNIYKPRGPHRIRPTGTVTAAAAS